MLNSAAAETLDFGLSLPQMTPLNVLILDDSNFDRLRIKRELHQSGIPTQIDEITCVCNLKDMLSSKVYDLVVIDYYLPDGTGDEAIKILRADPLNEDTQAAVVSGNPWVSPTSIQNGAHNVTFVSKDKLGRGEFFRQIMRQAVSA